MKPEAKVGIMFAVVIAAIVAFIYALGAWNPFANTNSLRVAYNFAGGIEVGSPVRVMGIKVGKVKSIDFEPDLKMPNGEEVKLVISIAISKRAWNSIRHDSRFYINIAGVIGEKFLEITPGSMGEREFSSGELVRGEDPPRVDQLLSQSYALAGKVMELIEKNEGSVIQTIETMNKLVTNFDKVLRQLNRTTKDQDIAKMLRDLAQISDDVAFFTQSLRGPEGQKTIAIINKLIGRMEPLDAKAIRKFLQEEGIKARMF